jgi:hypothetical protein
MMRLIAPLLILYSMVCLTAPDGVRGIWLQKDQIVSILHGEEECVKGANTKVTLGNGTSVCVRETPKETLRKIEEAK